ncbi:MAG TPA: hypothetical protein VF933_26625 [Streptosporangiaceae bacterium]
MAIVAAGAYPAGMDAEGIVRSGDEIRRVLARARGGISRYGFGEELSREDLALPWKSGDRGGQWMDNAWLRGVRDLLEWVLAGRAIADLYDALPDLDEIMQQGSRRPVEAGWPPPQSAEAMDATEDWLTGETDAPPACEHGGVYRCGCSWIAGLTPEERAAQWWLTG